MTFVWNLVALAKLTMQNKPVSSTLNYSWFFVTTNTTAKQSVNYFGCVQTASRSLLNQIPSQTQCVCNL